MAQDHSQNLEQIRSSLRSGGGVDIGSVHLSSSKSVIEMNVRDHVLMIVNDSSSGVLAVFKSDGKLSDSLKLGTIVSSQAVDLNDGDTGGIAIDEVEGKGTGVVLRQFKLYSVTDASKLDELRHAPSFARKAPWSSSESEPKVTTERGYLNFNRGALASPRRCPMRFVTARAIGLRNSTRSAAAMWMRSGEWSGVPYKYRIPWLRCAWIQL